MKKIYSLISMLVAVLVLSGCGKQVAPPLYSWGNYVDSSTNYGMNGHEIEVVDQHLAELRKIIDESNAVNQRVAPGIYAEYAQILFETNKKENAKKYFLLEKQTYPESNQFIDLVMAKLYGDIK